MIDRSLSSYGKALMEAAAAALAAARARLRSAERAREGAWPALAVRPFVSRSFTFPAMVCSRTDTPATCRLRIEGVLDVHTAPEIRAVFQSVASALPPVVKIDLEGLTGLDSSGVGAIVSLFKRVRAAGGSVIVSGVRNQPLEVCNLLKLGRVFRGVAAAVQPAKTGHSTVTVFARFLG